MVKSIAGGEGCVAIFKEGEADEVVARDGEADLPAGRDANDATLTTKTGSYIEIVFTSRARPWARPRP